MSEKRDSKPGPEARGVPEALAPGLDLFAAAWLQIWTDEGGSVHVEKDGRATMGFPEGPLAGTGGEADQPNEWEAERARWLNGHHHGRMRALLDLLERMPGGAAAVKAHLHSHGIRYLVGAAE